jgi:multidrug transporter EmrE-like cation transporter
MDPILSYDSSPRSTKIPPAVAWPMQPYALIVIGALLNVAGEVLLKAGSSASAVNHSVGFFGFAALASPWTWIGVVCYIIALLNWLWVLRTVPVSIAFSLMNAVYVLVPLAANIFLHEPIHARRWLGIALVLGGALIIARPLAAAEEKL